MRGMGDLPRLLVISHPSVTPTNQSFFAAVSAVSHWQVSMIIPAQWRTEYGPIRAQRWPAFTGELITAPVLGQGSIPLHVYWFRMRAFMRRHRFRAIYVHNEPYALSTLQAFVANRMSERVPIGFYAAQNIAKVYPQPFRAFERWVLDNADFAFPVTHSALSVLRDKGFGALAPLLPLAIDFDVYHPSAHARASVRGSLGIDEDVVLFGYVGRLVEEKGLLTAVRALCMLPKTVSWHMAFVGDGPLRPALGAAIEASGRSDRFSLVGYVAHDAVARWIGALDVLVLPSESRPNWKEQFGRVLLEAWACGVPVVGSDSGEIPHLIELCRGGLVFREGDHEMLADSLERLARDRLLRTNLATAGQEAVRVEFGQDTLAAKFAETLDVVSGLHR